MTSKRGPFWTDNNSVTSGFSQQSCLAQTREMNVSPAMGGTAVLTLGQPDDALVIMSDNINTSFRLWYFLDNLDVTGGGKFDRIVFRFAAVPSGTPVSMYVELQGNGTHTEHALLPTGPGEITIPLSQFTTAGSPINEMRVWFQDVPGARIIELADIRLKGPVAKLVYADAAPMVIEGLAPLPEVAASMAVEDADGTFEMRGDLLMTVEELSHEGDPLPASLHIEDSVPGAGPGAVFGFTLSDAVAARKRADHRDGRIILNLPAGLPGEINTILGPPSVQFIPQGKVAFVEFQVETRNALGLPARTTSYRLRLEIPEERILAFDEVLADVLSPNSFELGFVATPFAARALAPGAVIVRGELSASEAPADRSTSTPQSAFGPALRVAARPSVFSSRTQLWVEGASRAGSIRIFDSAGREVQELRIAAGSPFVDWDGRDRTGRPVGSGVYFVRFAGNDGAAATKMIRLR